MARRPAEPGRAGPAPAGAAAEVPTDAVVTDAVVTDVVLTDGVLRLEDWLPFEFSYTTNRVSAALAAVYADRFGLSVTGWRVIAVLAEHAPCPAVEVARRLAATPVVITRAVAELLAQGMVSRRVDAADRRRVALRLTDAGRRVYRTVMPHARRIEADLLAGLSPDEIAALRRLMAHVVAHASSLGAPVAAAAGREARRAANIRA